MQIAAPSENPPVRKDTLQISPSPAHFKPSISEMKSTVFYLENVRIFTRYVYNNVNSNGLEMNKQDIIVTELVIHTLRMKETLKNREVKIEQLSVENRELKEAISELKRLFVMYAPNIAKQLELFKI